jgi:hypothetical protein
MIVDFCLNIPEKEKYLPDMPVQSSAKKPDAHQKSARLKRINIIVSRISVWAISPVGVINSKIKEEKDADTKGMIFRR